MRPTHVPMRNVEQMREEGKRRKGKDKGKEKK